MMAPDIAFMIDLRTPKMHLWCINAQQIQQYSGLAVKWYVAQLLRFLGIRLSIYYFQGKGARKKPWTLKSCTYRVTCRLQFVAFHTTGIGQFIWSVYFSKCSSPVSSLLQSGTPFLAWHVQRHQDDSVPSRNCKIAHWRSRMFVHSWDLSDIWLSCATYQVTLTLQPNQEASVWKSIRCLPIVCLHDQFSDLRN